MAKTTILDQNSRIWDFADESEPRKTMDINCKSNIYSEGEFDQVDRVLYDLKIIHIAEGLLRTYTIMQTCMR